MLSVMVPSTAYESTIVEVLWLPSEEIKGMLEKLKRDAIGDGWREGAYDGPSFSPFVSFVAPIVVAPVDVT